MGSNGVANQNHIEAQIAKFGIAQAVANLIKERDA
jgi:hypothetical protein